ncbi:MAG: thermonuclease family protein [Burkholderiales bacterium]|nr:thermonuclease family protein [Burkholderiales bacterium]
MAGKVVSIHDGDTLTVLVDRRTVKVRLASIDAPELGQPFGRAARESLAGICASRHAVVREVDRDRYGRTVGEVSCAGTDANAHQVRAGMAWVFTRYAPAGSPLYAIEADARSARRGLWSDQHPVAPWDWRRSKRKTGSS